MTLSESIKSAGQPAFSNANTTSDFIDKYLQLYCTGTLSQLPVSGTSRKAAGKSSRTENSFMLRSDRLSATQTLASAAYSASNCRQAPQGIGPPGARATTATAANFRLPL